MNVLVLSDLLSIPGSERRMSLERLIMDLADYGFVRLFFSRFAQGHRRSVLVETFEDSYKNEARIRVRESRL